MAFPTETVWTFGRLLQWTTRFLTERGAETPRLDAEVLLAHAQGCRRIDLYTRFDEPASEEVRDRFRQLVRQRAEGCPVAYLVGRKEFFSLEFEVDPAVLIPRPSTETLVAESINRLRAWAEPTILDVGTGSGNIAVTLAKYLPTARITAVDISAAALGLAQRNAERHAVADRITFLHGDLFTPLPCHASFDAIVSNPPYIADEELPHLPIGVRQYEPEIAYRGGPGGLTVVERLIRQAADFLRPSGYLLLEIGAAQEQPVRRLIESLSPLHLEPTIYDTDRHPRVLVARRLSPAEAARLGKFHEQAISQLATVNSPQDREAEAL
ncbi:Release factor glutamine methyltransferase [bacterium HR36]|uniref:Release factor glutamine methyltransferase n=1 Tax=uncultured Planctomycetota bacterium TaxID=120965 RepID=H5SC12_9BACT|nr:HemK protein [uncultured Planctomycetota bacterium]GBD35815.1 Release factor glutamine methyltransferase [bacterium HR36]